jgi:hypothetical protein
VVNTAAIPISKPTNVSSSWMDSGSALRIRTVVAKGSIRSASAVPAQPLIFRGILEVFRCRVTRALTTRGPFTWSRGDAGNSFRLKAEATVL